MTTRKKNTVPAVNVWNRMLQVWTNTSFIKTVFFPEQEKAVSRTWTFWFVWNSFVAVGVTIAFWFLAGQAGLKWVENEWWPTVPDFEMDITDGEFSTNLPNPYVFYDADGALVVIDTLGAEYTEESLRGYEGGMVVAADRVMLKDQNGEFTTVYFSDFEEDINFTKTDIESGWYEFKPTLVTWGSILVFICVWFWLCIVRLLSAVWWALIFWGIGNMARVPDWTFPRTYLCVLNFYIVPLVFEIVIFLIGVGMVPFSTLLVFGLVFGVNFYAFKKEAPEDETVHKA